MLYSIDRSKRIRLLPILIFIPYPKKMDKFIITLYFQTFGGNTMRITVEKRIEISNKIYPFYNAFSMDLLFYIAIDTLFLTVVKGFSAFQISLLGVVPTLLCFLMQPILLKIIGKTGDVNASRLGTFMLLVSAILITFGFNFWIIAIGQLIYDISFVFKNMESIVLKRNLVYQKKENDFFKIRGQSNTIYAIITFFIALIAGTLFNINPYLPMCLCIMFCVITCILSFLFYEVNDDKEKINDKVEYKQHKSKFNKVVTLGLLSNTLFLGLVVIGQQDSKLFIQYQLTDWYNTGLTATYLSLIVASSRIVRIVLNLIFNKFYLKFKNKISIILSSILVLAFAFIIIGAVVPINTTCKMLLMALGFDLIIPLRDTFVIYIEDLLLNNSSSDEQQRLFTKMELFRKGGKVILNLAISLLLLQVDLFYIMWLFLVLAILEIAISKKIINLKK